MSISQYFTNDTPRGVYKLTKDAPDWLFDTVYNAHGDSLPDDWLFAAFACMAGAIDEAAENGELDEERISEEADTAVEIRNHLLIEWMNTSIGREAVDDALDVYGPRSVGSFHEIIIIAQVAQFRILENIGAAIMYGMEKATEEEDQD